jgi:GTP pyrophosphokinase
MREYDQKLSIFSKFTATIQQLVSETLKENGATAHSLTFRVKSRASLLKKLDKPDAEYRSLEDVTDICGIRVITYFSDEVDRVASLLGRKFQIDMEHSIDKRAQLDPDRFGYLSFHYVVSLPESRDVPDEYHHHPKLKAEIQIRSILQHTWAAIEHDLGYKTTIGIPRDIRRRFSRLAGILELADEEFQGIRKSLEKYGKDLVSEIATTPDRVMIDRDSLLSYISTGEAVKTMDAKICALNMQRTIKPIDKEYIERHVLRLRELKIETIAKLQDAFERNSGAVVSFAESWMHNSSFPIPSSVSIYFLILLLAAQRFSDVELEDAFGRMKIPHGVEFIGHVRETASQAKSK